MTTSLILGGARSGKSRYAENLALSLSPCPIYLATSRIWDDDHKARIERHRRDRGPEWTVYEEDLQLSKVGVQDRVIVVDCVTLWLTNFFIDCRYEVEIALQAARDELEKSLALDNTWIFVSNELGQGLHATTESGRKFTDLQGFFNQRLATQADNVTLMVAGIPLLVKGVPPSPSPIHD